MSADKVSAETYLVLVPDVRHFGSSTYVYGVRADRIRRSKPKLNSGEIAVKVRLNFEKQSLIDSIPVIDLDVQSFLTSPTTAANPSSADLPSLAADA